MSAKPFRGKPYIQPANDPGIGQGRAPDRQGIDGAWIVWGVMYGLALWGILGFVWLLLK